MIALVLYYMSVLIVSLVVVFEGWKRYVNISKLKIFCVLKGLPIFGNTLEFFSCDNIQFLNLSNRFKTKYKVSHDEKQIFTWMGHILFMFSDHPETLKQVLNSEQALKKAYMYKYINIDGIFTSEVSKWRIHRKALNSTIGASMVKNFIPAFNEKSKRMVDLLEREVGGPINVHETIAKVSLDVVFETSFGNSWPAQCDRGRLYANSMTDFFERIQMRMQSIWMYSDVIYRLTDICRRDWSAISLLYKIVDGLLEQKRLQLGKQLMDGYDELSEMKGNLNSNFIQKSLQMEKEGKMNNNDIRNEMAIATAASSDTTANTVASIMLMFAVHQDYQDRVVDELRSIFKDPDEPVTNDHIQQIKLMDLVIKEGQRLFPIAPYMAREASEDMPLNGGIVPKGTTFILDLYGVQRNPKYWGENANDFSPERFLDTKDWHPYQYIPFSAGPRNCMGLRYAHISMRIYFAHLLRRYKFTSELKMQDIKVGAAFFIKILNKDPIRLERREW